MQLALDIRCSEGKIQILQEEQVLRIQQFNRTLWQAPLGSVTRILVTNQGMLASEFTICTTQGRHHTKTVAKKDLEAIIAYLHVVVVYPAGKAWYHDLEARTHSETYRSEKQLNKDMEAAAAFGWAPQAAAAGLSNVGAFAKAAYWNATNTRKKETTIIYVRTEQWLAENS